jgi:hypothetical protein
LLKSTGSRLVQFWIPRWNSMAEEQLRTIGRARELVPSTCSAKNNMNARSGGSNTDSGSSKVHADSAPQESGKELESCNNERDKCENEAELDELLTLVQASRQEHQVYEEDVLRQATLQLAPQLSIDTLGLPVTTASSLWQLLQGGGGGGGGVSSLDATALCTVLATTRRQIAKCAAAAAAAATAAVDQQSTMVSEENESATANTSSSSSLNLLYMKEQILLFALSNGNSNDHVQLIKEREAEQARSQLLIQQQWPPSALENTMRTKTTRRATVGHRISIMKRKRAEMNLGNDDNDHPLVAQNHANSRWRRLENELTESQRANLRALRLQRQARRRAAAQRQGRSPNDDKHNGESPPHSADATATAAFVDSRLGDLTHGDSNNRLLEAATADIATETALVATTTTTVTCPDCETSWTIANQSCTGGETADSSLARHLSQCRGRPSRRSCASRTRRGAASAAAAAPLAVSDPSTKTSNQNDAATINNDDDTDASNDTASTGTDNDFGTSRPIPRSTGTVVTRSSSNRNATRPAIPSTLSVAATTTTTAAAVVPLDDWNAHDYDDRVDDWLELGLDRMKILRERDVDEIAPGAVEYDGGLLIPAWINNRLFAYQRQGLECLWSWHLQKTGGIIGDEMGLVRREQPKVRARTRIHDCHFLFLSHMPFCLLVSGQNCPGGGLSRCGGIVSKA